MSKKCQLTTWASGLYFDNCEAPLAAFGLQIVLLRGSKKSGQMWEAGLAARHAGGKLKDFVEDLSKLGIGTGGAKIA